MHFFKYKKGELYAEEVPIKEIVSKVGTPAYIYSYNTLQRHFNAYMDAFRDIPHIICFALKANSNSAIIRLLANLGSGADVVSGGELYKALRCGIPPKKIVYAGVGKTEEEIKYSLESGILMFNVESDNELIEIDRIASQLNLKAPIALRVNPDIDPKTHPYIATGLKKHKFGISIDKALDSYRLAKNLRSITIVGVHKHIGSQITDVAPFVDALKRIIVLIDSLAKNGIYIKYLDIGGGLGITYNSESPPLPVDLAKNILPLLVTRELTLILEPGRSIVGNAGVLVTQVLYLKKSEDKEFVIVDAGMNDLIRPSIYGAYHKIQPVIQKVREKIVADIVGPICESGDFLAKEREIPKVKQGEYLAVMSAGAYGYAMSSNYNSRPRPVEVLVKGSEYAIIRSRETYEDLVKGEIIPDFI